MITTSAADSGNKRRLWIGRARRALVFAYCAWFLAVPPLASAGFIDADWTEPTTNADSTTLLDLAGYRVYSGTTTPACPGSNYLSAAAPMPNPGPGQTFPVTLTNLTSGTTYFVRVTAVDTSGNESACTPAVSGVARADLSVTPASLSFGNVDVGATATLDLTVQNVSPATLTGSATVAAPFSIVSGASLNLAPGASQIVRVRFAPTSAQTYAGSVNITTSGDDVTRSVSGAGIPAPPPVLQFSQASSAVTEGGTATVTVTRTGGTQGGVTVQYATGAGSATPGTDYTAAAGTLTFGSGQMSRTFTVTTLADTLVEATETITLTLSNPQGATLGTPAQATLSITDDDVAGTVQFGATASTVAEGAGSVTVNVTRAGGSASGVTVDYATADGTAAAGADYSARTGTLTFGAGVTTLPLTVPILQDATPEPSETFTVTLSSPAGGATLGATTVTTVTITDDEPSLQFSAATYAAAETAGTATITVSRVGSTSGAVTVNYATTTGGTATPGAGGDFTPVAGTLTFAAGQASRTFTVPVLDDDVVDGAKTVGLALSSPGGARLGSPSTATLTITDSDAGGTIQFATAASSVAEGAGSVTVHVSRTGGAAAGVTVNYATASGTATAGADYGAQTGTLSFGAGVTTLAITVPILQETTPEPSETFTVTLSGPTGGGVLGATTVTTVTITDSPSLVFSAATYTAAETAGTATITVSRVGSTAGAATVDYATTTGGTATPGAGGDFTPAAGTLTFGAGQASRTFTVPVLDDAVVDGPKTVGLVLAGPVGAVLGTPSTATLTITDSDAGGAIQFATGTTSVAESAGSVTVNVSRTGGTAAGVTVDYATANGIATAGADYSAQTGTLTFGAGVTSLPVTVPILQDALPESSETFTVTLSSPGGGGTLGATTVVTVTIVDDEPSLVFGTTAYTAAETAGTATITVNRVGSTAGTVTVDYATTGSGTATPGPGGDFMPVTATLTFAAGQATQTFTVPVLDDDVVDGAKTVGLVLTGPVGAVLGTPSMATLTITDSDAGGTIQVGASSSSVAEGAGSVTVNVSRTGGTAAGVTVNYATANGTAAAGADYSAQTGTLTFGAGVTSLPITVPILPDATLEPSETFTLTLSGPGGGGALGTPTVATVTITDDDSTLAFSAATYTATETAGTATITVTRTGSTVGAATVDYATTTGGTAAPGAGGDFTPVTGTLTLAAGQASRTFTVPVLDDDVVDGAKTVGLVLSNASGAGLGSPSTATLTITDSDAAGTIQFAAAAYAAAESAGGVTVNVTRTGGTAAGVTVNYTTANGSATAGADYSAQTGTLTFGAGVTSQPITVPILPDATPEPSETFTVTLSSPSGGGTLGATTVATVTITDSPSVAFSAAAYTAAETAGTVTITVTRAGSTAGAATVDYATGTGGTATPGAGGDFTPVSGTLTFAAGQASRTFTVPILDDVVEDGVKTVELVLTSPTGALLGTPSTATLTLTDNDGTSTLRFASAAYTVSESAGSVTLDVTRTGGLASVVTVNYATSSVSALAGGDFETRAGTLTFGAGVTTLPISVRVYQDASPEGAETFTVTLTGPGGGAALGTPAVATVTIVDASSLVFSTTAYSAAETAGTATITVNRVGSAALAVTVDYATTTNGTATPGPGGDFTPVAGTLTLAAGQTSRTFTVPLLDDDVVDGPKTVGLVLTNPNGAGLGMPSTATLTITDGDSAGTLRLASTSYTVAEGAGSVTINVSRAGGTATGVTVDYATADGTATAGADYGARSGTLTFGAGVTTLPITVPILQDATAEPSETFTLTLTNAGGGGLLGTPTLATVAITDDEPTLRFSATSYSAGEAAGAATITVTRVGSTSNAVTVNYATTTSGTAVAGPGGDFTPVAGTLTIAAGQASGSFAVPLLDDDVVDGPKTVGLVLSSPSGALLGTPSSAMLTITDSDTPGTVQFASAAYSVGEGAGSVTVDVTRTGGSAGGVTVSYATLNGSATAGSEYTARAGTLSFGPGVTTLPIVIPILQDTISNGAHTFTLTLGSPTGGATLSLPAVATVTIADDDTGVSVRFGAATYTATEAAGQATVTVTRVGGTAGVVTVDYATTGAGTATPGLGGDFTPVTGTLTFAKGQASRTFTVPVLDDDVVDGPKTVGLVLTNAVGALLGSPASATLTLTDNDVAGTIQFSAPQYWADEGGGTVNVTVTRTGGTAAGVSATYAIIGGTAAAGSDFLTASAGTLTFARGVTSMTIPITLTGDTQLEGTETLELALSSPGGGALLGANRRTMVMIEEVSFQFAPAVYAVSEGGVATVTVTRTGPVTRAATVEWTTSDGSAVAGTDYNAAAGTLSFPAGMRSRTFTVTTLHDTVVESPETVLLTLRNPGPGAILGAQRTAALTITDNDFGGRLAFAPATHVVAENRGSLNVPVVRTGGIASNVTVAYAVTGGTATGGADYMLANGILTFTAGQTTALIPIVLVDDGLVEPDETIVLQLSAPTGGATLGTPSTVTVRLTDNDRTSTLQFSAATYTVVEGAGTATVTLTRTGSPITPASVVLTTSDGTARRGVDYTTVSTTVLFDAKVTSRTVTIPIIPNTAVNGTRTVNLTLTGATAPAALGAPATAVLSILDDDSVLALGASSYGVTEGGTGTITVRRTGSGLGTVSVGYAVTGITATSTQDYATSSGRLTFGPGVMSQTFSVRTLADALVEGNETVQVALSAPLGQATLGTPATAVVTIADAPPLVRFGAAAYTVTEGTPTATITAVRTGATTGTVTVDYGVIGGTATGAGVDYTYASGTLTFLPGVASRTFTIAIANDSLAEGPETVVFQLGGVTGAVIGTPATTTLTIQDDEPHLRFGAATYTVGEATAMATITVLRSGTTTVPVTVNYSVSGGTATGGGVDYAFNPGTLSFEPGVTSRTFTVTIINDGRPETPETVVFGLSGPSGAKLGTPATTTLTIVDNEPQVRFAAAAYTVSETTPTLTVTVLRTGPTLDTVTVDYGVTGGTAASARDYTLTAGTLTFGPGVTSRTFAIAIANDAVVESVETILLALGNPVNASLATPSTATVSVTSTDDVGGRMQFASPIFTANEGGTAATITVTRLSGLASAVSVDIATLDGTARAGAHYAAVASTLTFAAGQSSATVTVPLQDDGSAGAARWLSLVLSNPAGGGSLGTPSTAVLWIADDD